MHIEDILQVISALLVRYSVIFIVIYGDKIFINIIVIVGGQKLERY